jgi:hypothetical protein
MLKYPRTGGQAAAMATLAVVALLATTEVYAQRPRLGDRYVPLDQFAAPGTAGRWSAMVDARRTLGMQPIVVEFPGRGGSAWIYTDPKGSELPVGQRNPVGIQVGPVYRMRIAEMDEFPGVELFPTIELLDKLHPPAGRETEFPVPIAFSLREIELALDGKLVTKVIYLEKPNRAKASRGSNVDRAALAEPYENPFEIAHREGRPMAIVRLGGRLPDINHPDDDFFGGGAPVVKLSAVNAPEEGQ